MVIFNSYVSHYQRVNQHFSHDWCVSAASFWAFLGLVPGQNKRFAVLEQRYQQTYDEHLGVVLGAAVGVMEKSW